MSNPKPTAIQAAGTTVDPNSMHGQMDVVSKTADYTIVEGDSNVVFLSNKTSGNHTFTLPKAGTVGYNNRNGLIYTFILGNVGTQLFINPIGSDVISCKASEGGANVLTSAGVGIKNTTATHILGDRIQLVSNGVDTWIAIEQSGTWATQP
jgi:hypothetical protein